MLQLTVCLRNGVLGAAVLRAAVRDLEEGAEILCSRQKEGEFLVNIVMIISAAIPLPSAQVQRQDLKLSRNGI